MYGINLSIASDILHRDFKLRLDNQFKQSLEANYYQQIYNTESNNEFTRYVSPD